MIAAYMDRAEIPNPLEYATTSPQRPARHLLFSLVCVAIASVGELLLWQGTFASETVTLPLTAVTVIIFCLGGGFLIAFPDERFAKSLSPLAKVTIVCASIDAFVFVAMTVSFFKTMRI